MFSSVENCCLMQENDSVVAAWAKLGSRSTTRTRPAKPIRVSHQAVEDPMIAPPMITTS